MCSNQAQLINLLLRVQKRHYVDNYTSLTEVKTFTTWIHLVIPGVCIAERRTNALEWAVCIGHG